MLQFLSNPSIAWPLVFVATVIETIWFIVLKKAGGLEIWPWNLVGYVLVFLDIPLLSIALKTIPVGSVYAFWTGASALAITVFGIYMFDEPVTIWRLVFIVIVVIGLVGLKMTS